MGQVKVFALHLLIHSHSKRLIEAMNEVLLRFKMQMADTSKAAGIKRN